MANKIPLAIADVELQLAAAVSVGGETLTLNAATDDDGNALPAGMYCFTVDSGSSNKEYLIGQLNGVNVTSVKSVSRQGVESTGAARAHRVGAPCIVTNFATLQRVADVLRGVVALDGSSPIIYDAEPTLSDRKSLATVGYVLDTVTGGSVSFDKQTVSGTGGATIVAGDLVYFNETDQEWYLCDADTAATVEGVMRGIALGAGSDGVGITNGVHLSGVWTTTGLTPGALYYASNTAGGLATSAGTIKHIVGVALSTTQLWVIPQNRETISTRTKDALAGDGGTPSSDNPFRTRYRNMTAGETISGATTPIPVYQSKVDNEFYACDANDTGRIKFIGFAVSNGTDGNSVAIQFSGVVAGFTGLSEGEKYYVQDTVGTIGTTIGTYEVLVGVAISETELLIQKGKPRSAGTISVPGGETGSSTVTTGFRPSIVRVVATNANTGFISTTYGIWVNGSTSAIRNYYNEGTAGSGSFDFGLLDQQTDSTSLAISSITDTGFTIGWSGSQGAGGALLWEAEGEL